MHHSSINQTWSWSESLHGMYIVHTYNHTSHKVYNVALMRYHRGVLLHFEVFSASDAIIQVNGYKANIRTYVHTYVFVYIIGTYVRMYADLYKYVHT